MIDALARPERRVRSNPSISERGEGGDTHQIAGPATPVLTTQQGAPVADDQNSLKVGPRGPTLLEGFHFRERSPKASRCL